MTLERLVFINNYAQSFIVYPSTLYIIMLNSLLFPHLYITRSSIKDIFFICDVLNSYALIIYFIYNGSSKGSSLP